MKKYILFLIIFYLNENKTVAQNTIIKNIDEVIVSANRAKSDNNTSNIHIISNEEIKNAPVQTIEDLLEYAVNIDVRQRGRQGVQSDISIRAGTFEQVLVMLNGIKLNDPQTGHHTLNLPVSLAQIERIEIITGGASRIFGNYAYTGAINIITKVKTNNSINISLGENKFNNNEINYHISSKKIKHNISLNHKKSDGYTKGTDYIIKNYFYQAKTNVNDLNILLNAGFTDKKFGAYSFYSTKFPDQYELTKTRFTSLQIKKEGSISIENKLYWRRHNDEFILFRDNPSWYHNFHETNVFGLDINLIQKTKRGSNVIGMEIRTDNIISNLLGEQLEKPIHIDSENMYSKGASRSATNIFAEKNIDLSKLFISTGVMINIDSKYGNEYFPGIDITYNLQKNTKLFFSINKSMRTPNYTELYYISPTNEGNVNLKSEYSTNKEVGIKWNTKAHKTSITYYQRKGENLIDWILLSGDSIWRTQNLGKITTSGFELNSKINFDKIFNTNSPFTFLSINYCINKSDTTSQGFQSAYVLDYLKSKFSLSLKQKINQKTKLDWRATFQDREGEYTDYISGNEIKYPPFWLISARLTYKVLKTNSIFIEINNLFDKQYVDFGNIPLQGRWIRTGFKIKI